MNTFAEINQEIMENIEEITNLDSKGGSSLSSYAIKNGLIISGITVLYSLLLYATDLMFNVWLSALTWLVVIIGIFYAIKNYRDKINRGYITFGKAFTVGVYIVLIYAVISVAFGYILTNFIDPQLTERAMQQVEERLLNQGLSDDMIEQQMDMQTKLMDGPLFYVGLIIQLFSMVFIGLIISLVGALIFKKQDDSFNATFKE